MKKEESAKENNPKFDEKYLDTLIKRAKKNWKGINPEEWLKDLRGDYEV